MKEVYKKITYMPGKIVVTYNDTNYKKTKNHKWYLKQYMHSEDPKDRKKKLTRCVETGKVYESAAAAARLTGHALSTIKNAVHLNQPVHGYHWEYVEPALVKESDIIREKKTENRGRKSSLPVKIKDMTPEQLRAYHREHYQKNKTKKRPNKKMNWLSRQLIRLAKYIEKITN